MQLLTPASFQPLPSFICTQTVMDARERQNQAEQHGTNTQTEGGEGGELAPLPAAADAADVLSWMQQQVAAKARADFAEAWQDLNLPEDSEGSFERDMEEYVAKVVQDVTVLATAEGASADFLRAMRMGNAEAVREVLEGVGAEERQRLLTMPMMAAQSLPLHCAATEGSLDVMRMLLEAGAPVDLATSDTKCTALHKAAAFCRPESVELLLSRGANPLLLDGRGRDALQCAKDDDWGLAAVARGDLGPEDRAASQKRCVELLEAACAAAAPELHRERKAEAACGSCGGQERLMKCGGCGLVWYCSTQCQRKDWRAHKQRCKVAADMRERLAVLADLGRPAPERIGVALGLYLRSDAARLAAELQGLRLLMPVVPSDVPVTKAAAPNNEHIIPSICAITGMLHTALHDGARPLSAPLPSVVLQFCQLRGPEVLLQRLAEPDAPVDHLKRLLAVMGDLSSWLQGQVLGRALLQTGTALPVAQLLCTLACRQRNPLSMEVVAYVAGILAALVEAERAQPTLPASQHGGQHGQAGVPSVQNKLLADCPQFFSRMVKYVPEHGTMKPIFAEFLSCVLRDASAWQWLLTIHPVAAATVLLTMLGVLAIEPSDPEVGSLTPAINWLAFAAQQQPPVFSRLPTLPLFREQPAAHPQFLRDITYGLVARLAKGSIPHSACCFAVQVEQLRRKAATILLRMLQDLPAELNAACRAACQPQLLQRAVQAAERDGTEEGAAVAALLRQAAAIACG